LVEHAPAETPALRRVQRVLDESFWPMLLGGCHTGRNTIASIGATGFRVNRLERFRLLEGPRRSQRPRTFSEQRPVAAAMLD
jgi:hypothetical protein